MDKENWNTTRALRRAERFRPLLNLPLKTDTGLNEERKMAG